MSEREVTIRTAVVTYFPMFIATLSLITSIYNGYLNNRFVDIIQRNIARGEYAEKLQGNHRRLFPGQVPRRCRQPKRRA